MSHPSYAKGYRFEVKVKDAFSVLGKCVRSFMSRGADLTLTRHLREWKISCKCKKKPISKFIVDELETHDLVVIGHDRSLPIVCGYLPKFIEIAGDGE